jgi:tripartite-type tricarboxylate transporter receptor subunit TctC
MPAYPDVPTMAERGFRDFDFRDWQGIVAPAGTPKEIIARVASEIARIVVVPEIKERFVAMGMESASDLGPAPFGTLLRSEQAKWAKVVREAGIRAE